LPYIKGIKLERFRGIKEGAVDGLEDLTILVGKNGAGKSTILEALYLASAWLEPRDPVRGASKYDYIVERRGGRGDWSTSRDVIWYSMDTQKDITITLDLGKMRAEYILHHPTGKLWLRIDNVRKTLATYLSKAEIRKCSLLRLEENQALFSSYPPPSSLVSAPRGDTLKQLQKTMPNLIEALSSTLLIDQQLLSRPDTVENYSWTKILAKRLDREVVKVLKEEFEPDAEGLTYAPVGGSNVLMLQLHNTSVRIDDIGDGAKTATLTTMAILADKPKLLLIEEPETKIHPQSLEALTKAILKTAKKHGTQIIATTHSPQFTDTAIEQAKNLGIPTSIIQLQRSPDGTLTAKKQKPH